MSVIFQAYMAFLSLFNADRILNSHTNPPHPIFFELVELTERCLTIAIYCICTPREWGILKTAFFCVAWLELCKRFIRVVYSTVRTYVQYCTVRVFCQVN